jgi:hypothetical protein
VTVFNGDEASSIVKRLGLIMFRITMILTAIRKFEGGNKSTKVFCTDQDFDTAMQLSKVYIDHSIFMFNNLPKQEKSTLFKRGSNKQAFFDELLTQFKRVNAVELGKKHGLGERTVDKLLKKLLGEYLKQESYGTYTKINKSLN